MSACHGLAALLLGAMAVAGPAHAGDERIEDWIGRVDRPLPSGYRNIAGTCIGANGDVCDRMVSVIRDEQSGLHALLATRRLLALDGERIGEPLPYSLVTDALEVDAIGKDGAELTVGLCQRDGVEDGRIVAVIHPDIDTQWYVRFERLWRLGDEGRFMEIPANGVRCLNEGYGYEG